MEITNHKSVTIATRLHTLAESDPFFKAACELFAARERGRREVTLASLKESLKANGKDASAEDVVRVLRHLADLNLGRLSFDARGRIRALTDIRVTLQSIGRVALKQDGQIVKNTRPTRLKPLAVMPQTIVEAPKKPAEVQQPQRVILLLRVGDKVYELEIPEKMQEAFK